MRAPRGVGAFVGTAAALVVALGAIATACGQFPSGSCNDTLTCSSNDAAEQADAAGDVVVLDTYVLPDGPVDVPEGCSPGEDCTNGIDDNCNGLIDCADPLCNAGYTCALVPPGGWSGPVLYEQAASAAALGACASAYVADAVDGQNGLDAGAATCGCSCGAVNGASCNSASAKEYSDTSCTQLCATASADSGVCGNFMNVTCGQNNSVVVTPDYVAGSCSPSPTKNVPSLGWEFAGRACGYVGKLDAPGGCTSGSECVARPLSSFGTSMCIMTGGVVSCPTGPYSVQKVVYAGVSDTRGCSSCTCSSPSGSCTGSPVIFEPSNCQPPTANQQLGTCNPPVTLPALSFIVTLQLDAGTCAASSVQPTGNATASQPTTVCCTP